MFLHIGGNIDILNREIIAILNIKTLEAKKMPHRIKAQWGNLTPAEQKNIKSVIITREEIYFSPISSLTLQSRGKGYAWMKEETYGQ